jgi:predicted transcriptional regulator of viral defense system
VWFIISTHERFCIRYATGGQARSAGVGTQTLIVRPSDVERIGVPREYLLRLHHAGQLERIGRGLYRLPNSPVTERHNFAQVTSRVPDAVICPGPRRPCAGSA